MAELSGWHWPERFCTDTLQKHVIEAAAEVADATETAKRVVDISATQRKKRTVPFDVQFETPTARAAVAKRFNENFDIEASL